MLLSSKLRKVVGGRDNPYEGIAHWCPGCEEVHVIKIAPADQHPVWSYDSNHEMPTINPSVRIFVVDPDTGVEETLCHYFLRAGKIDFCGDCCHSLSGKLVDLPLWPYPPGEYGGVED